MAGKLAIDFGTSNTVLALWDDSSRQARVIHIPEYGRLYQQGDEVISLIPSLVHYANEKNFWIGNQVLERGLYDSPQTLRWMKRYISLRSPLRLRVGNREITPTQAGQDFLVALLTFAFADWQPEGEAAFSIPVEAFEHYENWLLGVAELAGLTQVRVIDEPSAAALGYGLSLQPGQVFLIFDFGGGTLHVAVVRVEESLENRRQRCRVLGKAGRDLGGARIDQWLFQEVLRRNRRTAEDPHISPLGTHLLVRCEKLKETLSFAEEAHLDPVLLSDGSALEMVINRSEFEQLLDDHGLFTEIHRALRSALNQARERGYDEDQIQAVLMIGGSSQIPSVQRLLRQIFGRERVMLHRPMDAVALGAAAFVGGVDFFDYIQHDYAIRYVDPQKDGYQYRVIVRRGTPYPTREPVARLTVKAAYNGQSRLGLAIFEMSDARPAIGHALELVFDPAGAARLVMLGPQEEEARRLFWMNEHNPTFLLADPPAVQGEPRFEVEFYVDANKRLLINARDLQTGAWMLREMPVVRLS